MVNVLDVREKFDRKVQPVTVFQSGIYRPFVHINFALDDEARTTTKDGKQTLLSCDRDWQRVHRLREQYSAIAVGAKTWLNDSPRLTARSEYLGRPPMRQPDRVIFAGGTPCPFTKDPQRRTFLIGGLGPIEASESIFIHTPDHDVLPPLKALQHHNITSLLVEGGLTLIRSFLSQGVLDLLTIYVRTTCSETAIQAALRALPRLPADALAAERFGNGVLLSTTPEP